MGLDRAFEQKQKFRWFALNRHLAKREIIAVLNGLGITKPADFIALVYNSKTIAFSLHA